MLLELSQNDIPDPYNDLDVIYGRPEILYRYCMNKFKTNNKIEDTSLK